jgi:beta-N-acetylhexosaminidase
VTTARRLASPAGVLALVLACAPATPGPAPTPTRQGQQRVIDRPAPPPVSQAPGDLARTLPARRAATAWADSVLRSLSLRDKVAQLIWPWILGDYVPIGSAEWQRLAAFVTESHVGGFIVSVGAPVDIAVKVNALQRLAAVPLLMSADEETGVGFRARGSYFLPNAIDLGGATNFPLQMALGAANDTALAYAMGRVTAVESRAIGIQVSFGPVLDVNNNPANPVIGARSVGEDPQVTARMGAALVRGLQDYGVLATGKHFPGHGDTGTNSHLALAEVTASRARLDSVELVPFKAAIAAGVGAIMTFHGYLPALDSAPVPATLSPRVMTGLLREQLDFKGLLVTDAMTMAGVVNTYGDAEAAKRAIAAGADVLLMPTDVGRAIDAVLAGITEGRYDAARIDASVRRVLALKHEFGLAHDRYVDLDQVRRVVGDSSHVAVANAIAERGFVLARDPSGLVPLTARGARPRVLSVTYAHRSELSAGTTFDAELRRGVASVRSAYVDADEPAPNYGRILDDVRSSDAVVVGSYVNVTSESATADAPRAFVEFVDSLLARNARVVLVSFGSPYLLMQTPRVPAYAVAWGGSAASQRAAARALLGEIAVTARLPIAIPPLLSIGAGERRAALVPVGQSPRD